MSNTLLSVPTAQETIGFSRVLKSSVSLDSRSKDDTVIGNVPETSRAELENLSQSPNKSLAIEAEAVFNELLGSMAKGGHQITDSKVIQFVNNALKTKDRSFNEKLSNGREVVFLNGSEMNFSFYETRTQTAEAIARRNSQRSPDERLVEQDTQHRFQAGMLTIQQFGDKDIRISVSETQQGEMKGFTLAA